MIAITLSTVFFLLLLFGDDDGGRDLNMFSHEQSYIRFTKRFGHFDLFYKNMLINTINESVARRMTNRILYLLSSKNIDKSRMNADLRSQFDNSVIYLRVNRRVNLNVVE